MIERKEGSRDGFTLLELLVAISITSLLLILLSTMLSTTLDVWRRETNRYQKNVEGGAVLDVLSRDLRSIVPKLNGPEWFHLSTVSVEDLGDMPWLMFLASPQGESGEHGTGVCAVSYRIEKRNPFGSIEEPIHALYRKVLSPEDTFAYFGSGDLKEDIWTVRDPVDTDSLMASYIVDFEAVFTVEKPDGGVEMITPEVLRLKQGGVPENETSGFVSGSKVQSVAIRIAAINREGQYQVNDGLIGVDEAKRRFGEEFQISVEFPSTTYP